MIDETMKLLKTGEWLDIAYQAKEKYKKQSEKYEKLIYFSERVNKNLVLISLTFRSYLFVLFL
jgi:hypothetical protein